jgi:hypothetical protein
LNETLSLNHKRNEKLSTPAVGEASASTLMFNTLLETIETQKRMSHKEFYQPANK